jgi:hypothetical protein
VGMITVEESEVKIELLLSLLLFTGKTTVYFSNTDIR